MNGNNKDAIGGLIVYILFTGLTAYLLSVASLPESFAEFFDNFLVYVSIISFGFFVGGLTLWFMGDNPRGVSIAISSSLVLIVIIISLIL